MGLCFAPPVLISEYCPRGSVFSVLREARESPALAEKLTWALRLRMVRGVGRGGAGRGEWQSPGSQHGRKMTRLRVVYLLQPLLLGVAVCVGGTGQAPGQTVACALIHWLPCWLAVQALDTATGMVYLQ